MVTVALGQVPLQTELSGRLEASRVAQVRARAAGILQERLFKEGSDVKAGQALFRIDAGPYQAAMESAKASQARAEANVFQAQSLLDRYEPLIKESAISKQDYANAQASLKSAQADLAAAKAAVRTAGINLNYAKVTAPISGRIGRALVTEGALVGQGEATQLAVIQQVDPLYVNFTQSASQVMKLKRAMDDGKLDGPSSVTPVDIVLDDGTVYGQKGELLFTDLTVDATTGQVTLRAKVPNPDGLLLPGLFVRVRLAQSMADSAVLIPQQAVTRSAQGDSVKVVDKEGKIGSRTVQLGGEQSGQWLVLGGLKDGESVMVDGFQKVQMLPPGTPVKAVPWNGGQKVQSPGASAQGQGEDKPAGQ